VTPVWSELWTDRGSPWEHDPGPPRNRSWQRLFAETPNYRGLGAAFLGREVFRWHFGPMFYRGRLGDRQATVLVVGQEGAQDESLAHRSFVGGTGARMQHVLRHLGITRSYLFLNTFAYPIFGQYVGDLRILAQHPDSPIRRHRHRIFDYAARRNDLRLAIAVGTAAKESLASWLASRGRRADPARLHEAEAHVISPRLRMIGVLHPGGSSGGEGTTVAKDFAAAMERVERWARDDDGWLPADPDGERRPAGDYRYKSAPIPFRDLPYGAAWRVGRGGTSSNRSDDQTAIQIFSASGAYNNRGVEVAYAGSAAGSHEGYAQDPGDLPYEPPRAERDSFDPGPGALARLLQGGDPAFPWPDFAALGLRAHPSFGHGPIHRGRLDRPGVLVLADQASQDDLFTGRAASGDDGQHLQAFLRAAGLTRGYGILRPLPVDALGEDPERVGRALDDPRTRALHGEAVRRIRPQVIVAAGRGARRLAAGLDPAAPVVQMEAFGAAGWLASWRGALQALRGEAYAKDIAQPVFAYDGGREQIPRIDLPFGTLRWQGGSGDRGQRALIGGTASRDYYRVVMPAWAAALAPTPLSAADAKAIGGLR
jgi:uracil-DNA glycosylase